MNLSFAFAALGVAAISFLLMTAVVLAVANSVIKQVFLLFKSENGAVFVAATWKERVDCRLGRLEEDVSTLKSQMGTVQEVLAGLKTSVTSLMKSQPQESIANSPRVLTDMGKSMSKDIDARKLARSLALELAERFEGLVPYDIQELCYSYMTFEFKPDPDLEKRMKACAFKNDVPLQSVLNEVALELRDEIMKPGKRKAG